MNTIAPAEQRKVVTFAASVLDPFVVAGEQVRSTYQKNGRTVLRMSNVAIFRSGTFRDSVGEQSTFTHDDISMFAANFKILRDSGTFVDPVVRAGHPQWGVSYMEGLVGYVVDLKAQTRKANGNGDEYHVLFADYDIMPTKAQENIDSTLWRHRSAEIGSYRNNDDVTLSPVLMGFAFVDTPAVEFLNEFAYGQQSNSNVTYTFLTEEIHMSGANPVTPPTPVQPPVVPVPTPVAPVAPAPATFSIGGTLTTDAVAVQAHINAMEAQVRDYAAADKARETADREAFVQSLASGTEPKILASEIPSTLVFAKSLDAQQFAMWKTTMEGAQSNPVLGVYGASSAQTSVASPTPTGGAEDQAFANAQEIVSRLARGGVAHDVIKKSESYATVIARDPNYQLPKRSGLR